MFKFLVVVTLLITLINSGDAVKCLQCQHSHISRNDACLTAKGSLGTCEGTFCYYFKGSGHVGNMVGNTTNYQYREMIERGCGGNGVCNTINFANILTIPVGNSSNITTSCSTCEKTNCNGNAGNEIILNKVAMAIILLYFGIKHL